MATSPPFLRRGSRPSPQQSRAPQQHQMRRVSLPSALPQHQQLRARTPNSLSPKLGFLKEISEFDIDPPFISPAASSSSSADNSPMLLSPSFQRPNSARLYRRNQGHRLSQPGSPAGAKKATRASALIGRQTESMPPEDDGFRWTDVDGFYGRKNSIPLQQLLANDIALLNGPNLLACGEEKAPSAYLLEVDQSSAVNIPSDIAEDDDDVEEGRQPCQKQQQNDNNVPMRKLKNRKTDARRSVGAVGNRKLVLTKQMYSLDEQDIDDDDEEEEDGNDQNQQPQNGDEEAELSGTENGVDASNGGEQEDALELGKQLAKVKFAAEHSVDEVVLALAEGENLDGEQLRKILKAKRRRERAQRAAQQLRHFSIDANGQRVVDSGVRTVRSQLHPSKAKQARSMKARRATCPEIWLSSAEDEEQRPVMHCALRLYGLVNCGKKSVAKQLASAVEASSPGDDVSIESEDLQRPFRTVSFLLNEQEMQMELIQGSLLPESRKGVEGELTIFAVVYSVDNRESFIRAAQILYRLYGNNREQSEGGKRHLKGDGKAHQKKMERACVPLILVANKIDLQRKRRVSNIEGKMLAKIYKCPFVEISALLSANMDALWFEVLRKLHKYLQIRERLLQLQQQERRDSSGGLTPDTPQSSPRKAARQHALVSRVLERTRRFAKSCEDWISARIVAI